MNLSDKIEDFNDDRYSKSIKVEDVKEFIKKLKKTICPEFVWEDIDKLAGDELLWK